MKTYAHTPFFSKLNRFFFLCGLLMAGSELWKQLFLTQLNSGIYDWWHFPFQLCSIAMYVLLAFPWVKNVRLRAVLVHFLMCYSLLGGIAVFADTSGLHYPVLPLTVHSYLWHVLLIVIGVTAGAAGRAPSLRHFLDATVLYLLCCVIAEVCNHFLGKYGSINMFYINPQYHMQQIGFEQLVPYIGNTAAILVYIAATVCGAWILFLLWSLLKRAD